MNNLWMLAASGYAGGESYKKLLVFAVIVFGGISVYRIFRWFTSGPVAPEPWAAEVAAEMESEQARPICCHCLEPHSTEATFCPDCGAPVGQYTNLLPFPFLFSIGHLLRTGANGDFKKTPLNMLGFVLLGIAEYSIFAPFYWLRLILSSQRPSSPEATPPLPPTTPPAG